MTTHFVFVDAKSMVINMENMELAPHVVQATDDSGGRSAPNSNAASSRGMFGDASDETRQINAIEQVGDGAMGTLNFASDANSHRSQGDGSSEEISRIHIVGQVEDASMGSSSHMTISTSPTNPGSISSSWDGDNDEFCAELGRVYRREFRGQTVVWPHPEENIFSSAYVCPFSGECFLSGAMVERGYAGLAGDLQWYHSEDEAKTAALKRFFDCHHFRRQAPNSPADMNRHCREVPYRDTGDPVLPPAYVPQQARQRIQLYQQEALASAVPSMASSDISPLTFSNGSLTLRPPEQDTRMPPQNGVLVAPLVDRNARSVLNERYQDGIINGHHVQQCSIPDANFLVYKIGSSDQPYFTCMFVCPLFG
ncbi:unnamed protein product [Cylindrotheca closterium]|uniref:Uncharacterized protein n=1 Tax=Cylindrotheca closterium TaxID=2856 RepID=A0AAD2G6T9_9STRA|nr:unnamed protein product [Cylindrotheca closterium]